MISVILLAVVVLVLAPILIFLALRNK